PVRCPAGAGSCRQRRCSVQAAGFRGCMPAGTGAKILFILPIRLVAAAQAQGLSTTTERTGMHTTALVVKIGEHTAILYYSSRRHAGENLQRLLDKREAGLAQPLAMSDALASNEVAEASRLIRCHCLAHGRRKFSDLAEVFPHECQVVLEVLSA